MNELKKTWRNYKYIIILFTLMILIIPFIRNTYFFEDSQRIWEIKNKIYLIELILICILGGILAFQNSKIFEYERTLPNSLNNASIKKLIIVIILFFIILFLYILVIKLFKINITKSFKLWEYRNAYLILFFKSRDFVIVAINIFSILIFTYFYLYSFNISKMMILMPVIFILIFNLTGLYIKDPVLGLMYFKGYNLTILFISVIIFVIISGINFKKNYKHKIVLFILTVFIFFILTQLFYFLKRYDHFGSVVAIGGYDKYIFVNKKDNVFGNKTVIYNIVQKNTRKAVHPFGISKKRYQVRLIKNKNDIYAYNYMDLLTIKTCEIENIKAGKQLKYYIYGNESIDFKFDDLKIFNIQDPKENLIYDGINHYIIKKTEDIEYNELYDLDHNLVLKIYNLCFTIQNDNIM